MDLLLTTDHRFQRAPDGGVYTATACAYSFWGRYLRVFDRVFVIARVAQPAPLVGTEARSDGERVEFIALPDFEGPLGAMRRRGQLREIIANAVRPPRALLLRCPSQIATFAYREARKMDRPFAVEVVGDPADAYARGANSHLLRPFFRWRYASDLRRACHDARAVGYVAAGVLPHRYPARYDAATAIYSSIELESDAFADGPRKHLPTRQPKLVTVASMKQPHGGLDVLLRALKTVRESDLEATLAVVGDGPYREQMERLSVELGIREHVFFHGALPGPAAVREPLAKADLFVLSTPSEGLPRTLIEAMALALPCVATNAGGIPELLNVEAMVPPGNPSALAWTLCAQIANPAGLDRASRTNLERARNFEQSAIEPRRTRLYRHLQSVTETALTRFAPAAYAATLPPPQAN